MPELEDRQRAHTRTDADRAVFRRNAFECLDEIKNTEINSATRTALYWMATEWLRLASEEPGPNRR